MFNILEVCIILAGFLLVFGLVLKWALGTIKEEMDKFHSLRGVRLQLNRGTINRDSYSKSERAKLHYGIKSMPFMNSKTKRKKTL